MATAGHRRSGQDAPHHLAVDVGEAELAALVAVGHALVVDAAKVQDGGLVVVHMDRVAGDVPGEVIGGAVDMAALHAAAGHPQAAI